jgi:hypothetical protein
MKSKFYIFTFYLLLLTSILSLFHFLISEYAINEVVFYHNFYAFYLFHGLSTWATYSFLLFVNKTFFDKTGFAFLATGILKMFASVLFLMPLIQSDYEDKIPDIIAFFILYFIYLFFETIHAIKLLKP